jgi:hypothetical protein
MDLLYKLLQLRIVDFKVKMDLLIMFEVLVIEVFNRLDLVELNQHFELLLV